MKLKLKMLLGLLVIKAPSVTEKQIQPYTQNLKTLFDQISEKKTFLIYDFLKFISPIYKNEEQNRYHYQKKDEKNLKDFFLNNQTEALLFLNLITKNKVQFSVDFISQDFKIKNFDELINFLTFKETSISKFQDLAKTMLNITVSTKQTEIIIDFLKNNFADEFKHYANNLIFMQQELDFLSKKIGNCSAQDIKTMRDEFINKEYLDIEKKYWNEINKNQDPHLLYTLNQLKDKYLTKTDIDTDIVLELLKGKILLPPQNNIFLQNIINKCKYEKIKINAKTDEFIKILQNNKDKEFIINDTKNYIKVFNDFIANASNILKLIDTKKLCDIIKKNIEDPNVNDCLILMQCAKDLENFLNNKSNENDQHIKSLANAINFINQTSNKNSDNNKKYIKNSDNNKKYIIGGVIITAVIVCGAIWYWKSNQNF